MPTNGSRPASHLSLDAAREASETLAAVLDAGLDLSPGERAFIAGAVAALTAAVPEGDPGRRP